MPRLKTEHPFLFGYREELLLVLGDHSVAQDLGSLLSSVSALGKRELSGFRIVEPCTVHSRPPFPIGVGNGVKFASLVEDFVAHAHGQCEVEGVEHVVHAAFGFTQLAVVVALHTVDHAVELLGGLVLVALQAGFLHVVTRSRRPVARVNLTGLLVLHLGHVAVGATDTGLIVRGVPVRFNVGVLHLGQSGAGHVVLEVLEADLGVELVDLGDVNEREEVRANVAHADRLAGLRIKARVAVVLDVALGAHQLAVGLFKRSDLAGEAANAHVDHVDLRGLRIVTVKARDVRTGQSLDEAVAHDTRLGAVRIVAEVAVQSVVDVAHHIDNVGLTRELGLRMLFAEVGPVEHQVGRLAGPANRVARGSGAGATRLLSIVLRILVVDDVPNAEGTVAHAEVQPTFLGFEAAAEGAVAQILVKRGKSVAARKVVFLREAVSTHGAVEERVRSNARAVLLREARRTFFVDRVHGLELCRVAGTAGLGIHARHRAGVLARGADVLGQTRVAARAGNFLVSTGLVEAAEFMGLQINDNPDYLNFVQTVLGIVESYNKKYRTKDVMFNCEMIPAENVGVKHAKWDREDGYFVPRDCYNSYFYVVEDDSLNIMDKFKLHGAPYIKHLTGGSALHMNLEEHLSKAQYRHLLKVAAVEGCNYFTFNIPNTICNDCGHIDKRYLKECPHCHSKNIDYVTRIIGYLKRVSNFSQARQQEAGRRYYAEKDRMVEA